MFRHVTRSEGMAKNNLAEVSTGEEGKGKTKKVLDFDIKEWTGLGRRKLQAKAHHREEWRKLVNVVSLVPQWPPGYRIGTGNR